MPITPANTRENRPPFPGTQGVTPPTGEPVSEQTLDFALKGSSPNFTLELDGQFGGDGLLNDLKSGKLQIEITKWGGFTNGSAGSLAPAWLRV